MRYVILVSHGTFAPGLKNAMEMIIGKQENVYCTSMTDGMGSETYINNFKELIKNITPNDQILLMCDLAEGSPMTNALKVLDEYGLFKNTIPFSGMNLPMAVTAAMLAGELSNEKIKQAVLEESKRQIKVLEFNEDEENEEI